MSQEKIGEFLKIVHDHYPVGFGNLNRQYGYQEILKKVESKIDLECNDPESISNKFCDTLQKAFIDNRILNRNYFQFPNYIAIIELSETNVDNVLHSFYFEICLSLLCNYFTFYFVDEYRFKDYSDSNKINAMFEIHSFEKSKPRVDPQFIASAEKIINDYFPRSKYEVSSVAPYGEEFSPNPKDNIYNFYDLLFHYIGKIRHLEIVQ